jgi:outer membrane biosynthesis protein TonB
MIEHDRDRLFLSIAIALALHAIVFAVMAIVGLDFTPYPEISPVFVTLPEYETVRPEAEPEPTPPEPPAPVAEPEPEPPPEIAQSPEAPPEEPVRDLGAAEQPPAQRPVPAPVRPAPTVTETPSAPSGSDAPPGSFTTEDLPWLNQSDADDRAQERSSDELFAVREPDDVDQDLPSWVVEGEFSVQPESSLERDAQRALEQKRETVPGFAERLAELQRSLENPPSATTGSGSEPSDSTDPNATPRAASTSLPGGGSIEWVGSGSRRPVGRLSLPGLSAADFGGQVPARVSYLIVFEVNAEGLVVPGSLILRQSSGYTLADQKVRAAVSTWRFDPAPGAPSVTAIATLHISRDEIR